MPLNSTPYGKMRRLKHTILPIFLLRKGITDAETRKNKNDTKFSTPPSLVDTAMKKLSREEMRRRRSRKVMPQRVLGEIIHKNMVDYRGINE